MNPRRRDDQDALEEFATDESGIFQADGVEAIYYPTNEDEVSALLKQATAAGTPVTTSGAGTGITGGRVAVEGGIVISTQDLCVATARGWTTAEAEQFGNAYAIEVDEQGARAWVPAGLSLETLAKMLPSGLFYPPDPTEKTAFVGSTIITNASGARTFRYGPTRDWVEAIRVVLPTGERLTVTRGEVRAERGELRFSSDEGTHYVVKVPTYRMPDTKNAAGLFAALDMDLIDLFIGSEGILGIVTEACVKLAETPDELVSEIAFFEAEENAMGFVDALREAAEGGAMDVLSLEYFDGNSLRFMESAAVDGDFGAAVYTEIAGDLDSIDPLLAAIEEFGSVQDWFAETEKDEEEQKGFRHSLPDGVNSYLRRHGSQKLGTDMAVPAESFREMLAEYHAAGRAFAAEFPREGAHYVVFGHVGNSHVHVNFITHGGDELDFCKARYGELARRAVALGGTISAEHGVGKKTIILDGQKIPYLQVMFGKAGLLEIARVKKALDPGLVLDVGNIVPREYYGEVG